MTMEFDECYLSLRGRPRKIREMLRKLAISLRGTKSIFLTGYHVLRTKLDVNGVTVMDMLLPQEVGYEMPDILALANMMRTVLGDDYDEWMLFYRIILRILEIRGWKCDPAKIAGFVVHAMNDDLGSHSIFDMAFERVCGKEWKAHWDKKAYMNEEFQKMDRLYERLLKLREDTCWCGKSYGLYQMYDACDCIQRCRVCDKQTYVCINCMVDGKKDCEHECKCTQADLDTYLDMYDC